MQPIVLVPGCFDIIHVGHTRLLDFAYDIALRIEGSHLVVALNSDESVAMNKPGRPLIHFAHRREILLSMLKVDDVIKLTDKTPENLCRDIQPAVLVKGYDWDGKFIPERGIVETYGGRVVFAPHFTETTTTEIIKKCARLAAGEQ